MATLKMREWKNREQIAGVEMQEWKMRSIGSMGGKCSRLTVWKAEPILYSDTALINVLS